MIQAETTTTQLLQQLGDPAADEIWRTFDARYRPILAGLARRVGLGEEDAADVAQETLTRFVQAYRQGKYDRSRGRLRSWIIGIAKHVMADLHADRLRHPAARGQSAIEAVPDEKQLTVIWESERQTAILAEAMEELRRTSRTSEVSLRAFESVVFDRRAPEDVAAELGLSRHDVYVAKHRITGRLRAIVARLDKLYAEEE